MTPSRAPEAPLSPWWRRGALIVMAVGFAILITMTVLTYKKAPPIPARVVGPDDATVFTGDQIQHGQEVFLKYALMEHGTMWGHGAYLGPDYSAAYLHREAEITRDALAANNAGKPFSELGPAERAAVTAEVKVALKTNRYDPATGTLAYTPAEVASFTRQEREWTEYFAKGAPGQPAGFISDPGELHDLTAYFAWASWAARADRPGRDYSYTSNWPYEPLVGNGPTAQAVVWSAVSLVFLLGGLGLMLFIFGRFDFLGWRGEGGHEHAHVGGTPKVALTPSQRAVALYLVVVALLFLLQVLMGGALAHYRVEPEGFYGLDLSRVLPYNLLRTWHLQLAVFWIATAWVAGGLFLAPIVGGREPKGQRAGVLALLGALAVVVFGSLFGEYLGINNGLGDLWFWLGHQGSEYLDLGRFWQVLLAAGLVLWLVLMLRALAPALKCADCGRELASGQRWAIYFLMGVGFWNFVGAGVFGFLINLPIVSYFEMGTTLTPNHGHAAMFGVFGMLALAVLVYVLRSLTGEEGWAKVEGYFRVSFWGLNIGLALMIVLNLLPAGVVQLADVVRHGYAHARSLEFTMHGFFHDSEWVRIVGDMTFIFAGVVPLVVGTLRAAWLTRSRSSVTSAPTSLPHPASLGR